MTTTILIVEGVVIVLLLVLVGGLLKSHAEILRRLHALGAGEDASIGGERRPPTTGLGIAPATEIEGTDLSGATRSVTLQHGRGTTLLAFLSSGCASCRVFWSELGKEFELPEPDTRTVIVTKGPGAESPSKLKELAPAGIPLLMSDDAWDMFKVPLTPYFMLVDGEARILGEGSASTWPHLIGLLRQSIADADPVHLDTEGREHFTDVQLSRSGIRPGDPSLYENPTDR